jgi:hypothetical protein
MNLTEVSDLSTHDGSPPVTVEGVYAAGHFLLSSERIPEAAGAFRVMLKMAPRDERGWLGLGECHERASQLRVAMELYGVGSVASAGQGRVSVRCLLARARVLFKLGHDVDHVLQVAQLAAASAGNDELEALVAREQRRLS